MKRLKEAIDRFLEKLANENEKAFPKGPLDCCQLNRPENEKKLK
nr:LDCC motif putative metal-binding protein [Capillibacterium thermochitinicola]